MMTTLEAAEALNLTEAEVCELIGMGILPARKVGSKHEITPEVVSAYQRSFAQYESLMGDIVRNSVALGGYDLRLN